MSATTKRSRSSSTKRKRPHPSLEGSHAAANNGSLDGSRCFCAPRAIELAAEIGDDAAMKAALPSICFTAAVGACAALPVIAAEYDTGRDIAANCASCHHGDRRGGAAVPDL